MGLFSKKNQTNPEQIQDNSGFYTSAPLTIPGDFEDTAPPQPVPAVEPAAAQPEGQNSAYVYTPSTDIYGRNYQPATAATTAPPPVAPPKQPQYAQPQGQPQPAYGATPAYGGQYGAPQQQYGTAPQQQYPQQPQYAGQPQQQPYPQQQYAAPVTPQYGAAYGASNAGYDSPTEAGMQGFDFRAPQPTAPSRAARGGNLTINNPRDFNDIKRLLDGVKRKEVMIVDLAGTDRTFMQRALDFLSGGIFVSGGTMQHIKDLMYVLAPEGMGVTQLSAILGNM